MIFVQLDQFLVQAFTIILEFILNSQDFRLNNLHLLHRLVAFILERNEHQLDQHGQENDRDPVIVREGIQVTNLRHVDAFDRAVQGVEQARLSVDAGRAGELIAMDLRIAADALGEITGVITTDEILERIFAQFCIGK